MFAPKVAQQPQSTATAKADSHPRPSLLAAHEAGQGVPARQPSNAIGSRPRKDRLRPADPQPSPAREARPGAAWDFGSIPVLSGDRAGGHCASSTRGSPLPGGLQAKHLGGQVDDPLEQGADRIADVVGMRDPQAAAAAAPHPVGCRCAACEANHTPRTPEPPRRRAEETPGLVPDALRTQGHPLDGSTRSFFETRFGRDFGDVRVHRDATAERSAHALQAAAYTIGSDIVFGPGRYAPDAADGRRLLAHELVHVAQQTQATDASAGASGEAHEREAATLGALAQAGHVVGSGALTPAAPSIARQTAPYTSPYSEPLARELFDRLNALRTAEGAMSGSGFRTRVGAVAAVFDRDGNRIALIEKMNVRGGAHAEELILEEIRSLVAAGKSVNYTVLMVDQDPCVGICTPLLKQWQDFRAAGSLRTVTPMRMSKVDPNVPVSGKTAYKDALQQPSVPFEPKAPPPDNQAFLITRSEHSRVRLPLAPNQGPAPPDVTPSPKVAPDLETDAAKALASREERDVAKATLEGLGEGVAKQLVRTEGKQAWEAAAEAFSKAALKTTGKRLANAAIPLVGAAFSVPDVLKGGEDIAHGNVVMGVGTIGVALVDIAAQGLHLTDEFTAGGGTALAWTIQAWTATMQMGWESERVRARSAELSRYMREHGNKLPPRDQLMGYFGLNDEDILLLDNDIRRAENPPPLTTAELADRVRNLIAAIDAKAGKDSQAGPREIVVERDKLGRLLAALEQQASVERDRSNAERDAAEAKARQTRLDQALRAQAAAKAAPPAKPAQAAPALLPLPGLAATPGPQAADLGPFLSQPAAPSFNGFTMESAELRGTSFGRMRDTLVNRYAAMEPEHFPSDKVAVFQTDVGVYVAGLDQAITLYTAKGSAEWRGVQEMKRLRDAADNSDRGKLMR